MSTSWDWTVWVTGVAVLASLAGTTIRVVADVRARKRDGVERLKRLHAYYYRRYSSMPLSMLRSMAHERGIETTDQDRAALLARIAGHDAGKLQP